MTTPIAETGKRAESVIQVKNLSVTFQIARNTVLRAVNNVSFDVARGEIFGIIGESGSGKSTVARVLVGLLKPTEGDVRRGGEDFTTLSRSDFARRRRGYQMVFQDPAGALNPRMTVLQSVREPLDIDGALPRAERERVAYDCLERVRLGPDFATRYPHELSGGQKQRVNIARVLTMQPDLVVCDEAVAALDVSTQAEIINLFVQLQRSLGLTYVFISHDLNVVAHVSHRIGVMYLGRLVEVGNADTILASPMHPYTAALVRSQPTPVPAALRPQRQPALTGEIPSPLAPPSGCHFRTRCPYATELCAAEQPPLREIEPGRFAACHFAGQLRPSQSSTCNHVNN